MRAALVLGLASLIAVPTPTADEGPDGQQVPRSTGRSRIAGRHADEQTWFTGASAWP